MCWRAARTTFVAKAAYTRTPVLLTPGSVARRLSVASASCISAASPRNRSRYPSAVGTRSRIAKSPAWWGSLAHWVVSSGNGYPPRDTGGSGAVASCGRRWATDSLLRADREGAVTRGRRRRGEATAGREGRAVCRDIRTPHFLWWLLSGIERLLLVSSHEGLLPVGWPNAQLSVWRGAAWAWATQHKGRCRALSSIRTHGVMRPRRAVCRQCGYHCWARMDV